MLSPVAEKAGRSSGGGLQLLAGQGVEFPKQPQPKIVTRRPRRRGLSPLRGCTESPIRWSDRGRFLDYLIATSRLRSCCPIGGSTHASSLAVPRLSAGRLEIPRAAPSDRDQAGHGDHEEVVRRGRAGRIPTNKALPTSSEPEVLGELLPSRDMPRRFHLSGQPLGTFEGTEPAPGADAGGSAGC